MVNNENAVVIISGASSGIGLAMSKAVLAAGYHVIGLAQQFDSEITDEPRFSAVVIDLTEFEKLPDKITKIINSIDMPIKALINNAGIGRMGNLEQLSLTDLREVMDTNFMCHAMVTKLFLSVLKKQRQADIVFTGSEAALRGARQGSIYCASKFAIRGFAQALREECGKSNVRVTLINPGAVRTPFFEDLHFQPGAADENAIEPDDIAAALLMVLKAREGTVFDEINLSPLNHVWQRK